MIPKIIGSVNYKKNSPTSIKGILCRFPIELLYLFVEFRPDILNSFAHVTIQNQQSVQFQVAGAIKIHQGHKANGAFHVVMGPGVISPLPQRVIYFYPYIDTASESLSRVSVCWFLVVWQSKVETAKRRPGGIYCTLFGVHRIRLIWNFPCWRWYLQFSRMG